MSYALWFSVIYLTQISWSLTQQHDRKLAAWHNRKKTQLSAKMSGNHLAVTLNYDSGSITFSEVGSSSTLLPLYNFSTRFTQPICLGFGLYKPELNSRVTILRKIWQHLHLGFGWRQELTVLLKFLFHKELYVSWGIYDALAEKNRLYFSRINKCSKYVHGQRFF